MAPEDKKEFKLYQPPADGQEDPDELAARILLEADQKPFALRPFRDKEEEPAAEKPSPAVSAHAKEIRQEFSKARSLQDLPDEAAVLCMEHGRKYASVPDETILEAFAATAVKFKNALLERSQAFTPSPGNMLSDLAQRSGLSAGTPMLQLSKAGLTTLKLRFAIELTAQLQGKALGDSATPQKSAGLTAHPVALAFVDALAQRLLNIDTQQR